MDLKQKLAGSQWQLHAERELLIDGELIQVVIRRPPQHMLLSALEEAKKEGDLGQDNKPTSEWSAVKLLAKLTALCLFAPGGVRPLFAQSEVDTVLAAPWLLELQEDITGAVAHMTALVKVAQGNSEATPS